MATLVVSDLHLGLGGGGDLLREAGHRRALLDALDGVDRLVILGDAVELREVPAREAAAVIAPLLREAGERLGPDGEVLIVPGNHDHAFVGPWLESRIAVAEPEPLGLEHRMSPGEAGPLAGELEAHAGPARLSFAYPGVWLRSDVYAIHGSYADLHVTIPKFECLAAHAMARFLAPIPDRAGPDDYEACLAPLYAWIHAVVQRVPVAAMQSDGGFSARAWVRLEHGRRRDPRALAMRGGFAGAVALLNRVGVGPLQRDVSGPAMRRAYLAAIGEVTQRLGVDAAHVIWGHSHRPGPLPGDDEQEWRTPTGARVLNTGSWVLQRHFVRAADSPYRPGTAVLVPSEPDAPPRVRRLLEVPA
jgi:UDP-2,3-diacylglucosamine pyrophosphatase LpxH